MGSFLKCFLKFLLKTLFMRSHHAVTKLKAKKFPLEVIKS